MLRRPESITPLAIALQAAHAPRGRLRKRTLARTGAPRRFLERVSCPVGVIYGRDDVLYRRHVDHLCDAALALEVACIVFIERAGDRVQFG